MNRFRWLGELRQDLRYSIRALLRSPGFAAVAIISLALGIGANTVVFSVVNALFLRPLPVAGPERLYFIQNGGQPSHSFPNYRELRDRNQSFSDLAAYRIAPIGLEGADGSRRVWGYLATGNYFDMLGVRPALGRFFHPEDDRQPGASPYVVLSYSCWRSRFASDPRIVGQTVRLNGLAYNVLGVAPEGFHGTELFYWPEIWVPMMMQPRIEGRSWLDERATFNCWMMGRLKQGVTPAQAEADMAVIARGLGHDFPTLNEGLRLRLTRLGLVGDAAGGPTRAFLNGVLILAALVLLAACANLASLLAARASDRFRELAIRLSIGAGRGRIARQLLTEAAAISLLGGAAGCALAFGLLNLLGGWKAPVEFPVQFDVRPDAPVLLFSLAASLITGLLFGMAPARQALKTDPNQVLKGGSTGSPGRRWAFRDVLLSAQVALCCLLVTSSFVALRGLSRALTASVGWDAHGVSMVNFDLTLAHYSQQEGREFQRRALQAVRQLPGVSEAAFTNSLPLTLDHNTTSVFPEDATDFRATRSIPATHYQVTPGYFRVAGTRLLAGRDFLPGDDAKAPPVAVVNETFARRVVGTRDAVGKRFRYGRAGTTIEIVGIVEDGHYQSLAEDPKTAVFRPAAQSYNATTVLIARSSMPEWDVANEMRHVVGRLDPRVALYGIGSGMEALHVAFLPARIAAIALGAFGILAVMLAITGIYGMASYAVSRRVREIGIRIAVGARSWHVLRFVLMRTALALSIGAASGLALGLASGKVLSSIVYQASSRDPVVLASVLGALAAITISAAWSPARRALSIDPVRALRQD